MQFNLKKTTFYYHNSLGLFSIVWLCIVSFLIFQNWNPMTLHPLSLFVRQFPLFPSDVLGSIIKLFSEGWYELICLSGIFLSAIGLGNILLFPFKLKLDFGQRFTLTLPLGIGGLSYYTFFLGITQNYNKTGLFVTYAVLACLSICGALILWKTIKEQHIKVRITKSEICFFILVSFLMLFLFSKALRPAVFYDAITYHLGVPNYYLLEGGISYIPYDSCSDFPFITEMLYMLGIFILGPKLAQFISILILLSLVLTVYDFCRVNISDVNPALPAILCLSTPAFMDISICYTNDLLLAYYTIITIYCFFMWEKYSNLSYLILTGIFAGICIGIKYIDLMYVPILFFLLGITAWRRNGMRACIKTVTVCFFSAFFITLPWFADSSSKCNS